MAADEKTERGPATDPMGKAQEKARPERLRRFYETVTVGEAGDGYSVLLDGRPIRTPARRPVVLPTAPLAEDAAEEWRRQHKVVDPATMPLARLVNSALDGVTDRLGEVLAEIVKYAGSDLLCYRAEEPEGLVARQSAAWDPVLAWVEERFGARMRLAGGVMPIEQSAEAIAAIHRAVEDAEPLAAAALNAITGLTGSALLALAVRDTLLTIDDAWAAAHVDEDWNIAKWGEDEEAALRRARRYEEMRAAGRVLELLAAGERP